MVLGLKDDNGATVIVPIGLEEGNDGEYTAHTIPSIYGRAREDGKTGKLVPDNEWFVAQVKNGNLRYWDKKRSLSWARALRVQFPSAGSSNKALSLRKDIPKADRRVKTKDDLLAARQANPIYYQPGIHASHEDFSEFDASFIGSGEGAQIHGWGFYALRGNTEKQRAHADLRYRQRLLWANRQKNMPVFNVDSPNGLVKYQYNGDHWVFKDRHGEWHQAPYDDPALLSLEYARRYDGVDKAAKKLKSEIEQFGEGELSTNPEAARKALQLLESGDIKDGKPGQLFDLEIPDNDVLLHEDKPISGQPEKVKEALRRAADAMPDDEAHANMSEWLYGILEEGKDITGRELYTALESVGAIDESAYDSAYGERSAARAASEFLNAFGVEGIAYEGGIDGPAAVIFNADAIDILKTYYQQKESAKRGAIDFSNPQAVVYLFKAKNASTPIHELGHFFLENLREAAMLATSPEWVKTAWASLQQAYGFEGYELAEEIHERFAREFEAYAREGKAPSAQLETAFSRFRKWLTDLYTSVKKLLGNEKLDPKVTEVFDRLLATEAEIEAAAAQAPQSIAVATEAIADASPELASRYAKAVEQARQRAEAVIANRRLVEQRRENTYRSSGISFWSKTVSFFPAVSATRMISSRDASAMQSGRFLLLRQEKPSTRSPIWRAAIASSTVDMPMASAPNKRNALVSAGVSSCGPQIPMYIPCSRRMPQLLAVLCARASNSLS